MNILIIKLGALGDIIIASAVIRQIILHHPNDRINILTTPKFAGLFSSFDQLTITAFERSGVISIFSTVRWIRKQRFDRVYDLQSSDRTTIFCALSGIPLRIGEHPRYPYHKAPKNTSKKHHAFLRLNHIIDSVGIKKAAPKPFLPIPSNTVNKVVEWLEKNNLSAKHYAILHAGSSAKHPNKRWPYFGKLATVLSQHLKIIWVGGQDDIDINISLSQHVGINATNVFSIFELVVLGKKAKFAVANDSAPMHILSCANIPVFGLFGPTSAKRSHALGQLHNTITTNDKTAEDNSDYKPKDITAISVNRVLEKLQQQNLI